jgi:hypothetical protein
MICCGDKETRGLPFLAQLIPAMLSVTPKAYKALQPNPWSLTGVTQPLVLQSFLI